MVLMLRDAGWEVTVLDNLSRGHADAVAGAELVKTDLKDADHLDLVFAARAFDLVMHFAAFVSVAESVAEPMLYYRNNFGGTVNLLNAMVKAGVGRLVFSSSCAVYGIPGANPISEDEVMAPVNPYGSAKIAVEKVLEGCAAAQTLDSISLRYFNAAGCDPKGRAGERHDPETHLIPTILTEALRVGRGGNPDETKLKIYAQNYNTPDGSCIRDYIHVEDICRAHMLAAERLLAGRGRRYEYYNLANGVGFSVNEVIEACRRVTRVDFQHKVLDERRSGDPPALVGDSSLIAREMGWKPEFTDLDEIIRTAWTWMAKNAFLFTST